MIFRSRIDALATKLLSNYLTARWRRLSGRQGNKSSDNPYQRPHFYFPGLTARPWWDTDAFPWVARLEEQTEVLRDELRNLLHQGFLNPPPIEKIDPRQRDFDQMLVRKGAWHLYRLYYNGFVLRENCERCPQTTRLFRSIPECWGTVGFGVLGPRTHIEPHCGPSNAKLRCHLGLQIPENCAIRVEKETRCWTEGKCIVFDDSFEHEVWNWSEEPRYIFLFDVHHPELTREERHWLENTSKTIIKLAPQRLRKPLRSEPRTQPEVA